MLTLLHLGKNTHRWGQSQNNSFRKAKSFSTAKIQDLEHYVTPHLEHEKQSYVLQSYI